MLLHNFPKQLIMENGLPYWRDHKRPPQVIDYDSNDKMIRNFIFSAANIFAFVYGLEEMTEEQVMAISDKIDIPDFVPRKQEAPWN